MNPPLGRLSFTLHTYIHVQQAHCCSPTTTATEKLVDVRLVFEGIHPSTRTSTSTTDTAFVPTAAAAATTTAAATELRTLRRSLAWRRPVEHWCRTSQHLGVVALVVLVEVQAEREELQAFRPTAVGTVVRSCAWFMHPHTRTNNDKKSGCKCQGLAFANLLCSLLTSQSVNATAHQQNMDREPHGRCEPALIAENLQ